MDYWTRYLSLSWIPGSLLYTVFASITEEIVLNCSLGPRRQLYLNVYIYLKIKLILNQEAGDNLTWDLALPWQSSYSPSCEDWRTCHQGECQLVDSRGESPRDQHRSTPGSRQSYRPSSQLWAWCRGPWTAPRPRASPSPRGHETRHPDGQLWTLTWGWGAETPEMIPGARRHRQRSLGPGTCCGRPWRRPSEGAPGYYTRPRYCGAWNSRDNDKEIVCHTHNLCIM